MRGSSFINEFQYYSALFCGIKLLKTCYKMAQYTFQVRRNGKF